MCMEGNLGSCRCDKWPGAIKAWGRVKCVQAQHTHCHRHTWKGHRVFGVGSTTTTTHHMHCMNNMSRWSHTPSSLGNVNKSPKGTHGRLTMVGMQAGMNAPRKAQQPIVGEMLGKNTGWEGCRQNGVLQITEWSQRWMGAQNGKSQSCNSSGPKVGMQNGGGGREGLTSVW